MVLDSKAKIYQLSRKVNSVITTKTSIENPISGTLVGPVGGNDGKTFFVELIVPFVQLTPVSEFSSMFGSLIDQLAGLSKLGASSTDRSCLAR